MLSQKCIKKKNKHLQAYIMILELAILSIKDGSNADFERSIKKAQAIICQSPGYLSHEFQKCVEESNKYILLIKWTSLEAHNVGFRESALFQEWRALIGSYFEGPPNVQHYEYF